MRSLEECRKRIDQIDEKLMKLFEERMGIVVDVALYKQENNLPIFHKKREEEVIEKNLNRINEKRLKPYADKMLHSLMDISKEYQCERIGKREVALSKGKEVKLGFQGVKGSFGEEALIKYFGEDYQRTSYSKFNDIFEALKYNEIDYGVLPIENSSTGSITAIYDLLRKYNFHIVGEVSLKIDHNLLGLKNANLNNIEEIYSHEQGFEQSQEFLKGFEDSKKIPYYNTAISAKYVSELNDSKKCAIASKRAAKTYGLEILKENINDAKENFTRFIVISREFETSELCNKMTLSFSVKNEVGNLYNQLEVFSKNNINMRKIESRPVGNGSFNYIFYIDIDIDSSVLDIKKILEDMKISTEDFRILGAYKRQE